MIGVKSLIEVAKKWQKVAAMRIHKFMCLTRLNGQMTSRRSSGPGTRKGHVVLYTLDRTRFMVPVGHLNSPVFKEMFKLSEDEFGWPVNGPITLPCSRAFMEYMILAVRRQVPKNVEKDLIISIASERCSLLSTMIIKCRMISSNNYFFMVSEEAV